METFLTAEQVASQLSVEITTVYMWLRNSRLAGVKFGRLWRVRATDVEQFMQKGWQIKVPQQKNVEKSDISWIDELPQIDLSNIYTADAIFSREELYHEGESDQRLYGKTVRKIRQSKEKK